MKKLNLFYKAFAIICMLSVNMFVITACRALNINEGIMILLLCINVVPASILMVKLES